VQIRRKHVFLTVFLGFMWIASIVLGLRLLLNYESTPGRVGIISRSWPSISEIRRFPDRPTLVMLAHPHCPCTRASIGELANIMARAQGKLGAYVLFVKPTVADDDWTDTDLRRSTAEIPGVTVLLDVDGREARRFGAETSGHTLLFDRDGHLRFNGGITQARGHAGLSAGESAIISLVSNQPAERAETVVFGCSLASHPQPGKPAVCLK
jgi:hypothetical protein